MLRPLLVTVLPRFGVHRSGVGSYGGLYFGADKTLEQGSFFSGLIDDVRIYDDVLSAEEVAELAR